MTNKKEIENMYSNYRSLKIRGEIMKDGFLTDKDIKRILINSMLKEGVC